MEDQMKIEGPQMSFILEIRDSSGDINRVEFKVSEAEEKLADIPCGRDAVVIFPSGDQLTIEEALLAFRSVKVKAE